MGWPAVSDCPYVLTVPFTVFGPMSSTTAADVDMPVARVIRKLMTREFITDLRHFGTMKVLQRNQHHAFACVERTHRFADDGALRACVVGRWSRSRRMPEFSLLC
jgi:hypothetical protein